MWSTFLHILRPISHVLLWLLWGITTAITLLGALFITLSYFILFLPLILLALLSSILLESITISNDCTKDLLDTVDTSDTDTSHTSTYHRE